MASFDLTLRNSGITLETVLKPATQPRKTKIVCTIGPASWSQESLVQLIDAGMSVARINFSHGDHELHGHTLKNIRAAAAQRPNKWTAIMLDTKGPEIRTGKLKDGEPVHLQRGQMLEITTDLEYVGNEEKIACSYQSLCSSVTVGSKVLMADGALTMYVKEVRPEQGTIVVELANSGELGERKNVNLPGVAVDLPTITEKDRSDLVDFGVAYQVDFVAASFVRKGSDIDRIREVLGERGKTIKIIAKIENQEGLENFDEILKRTDAVMVARGDLGMELPPEKVFLAQKMMIRKCNIAGKPCITATQMLESMISNPRPFRSECTDIANAVLDGSDSVMLSGETAMGKYPIQAVAVMSAVCREAEAAVNYNKLFLATRNSVMLSMQGRPLSTPEAIASSGVKTCIDMDAKMLVVLTETGNTPRLVAKYRPQQPILVLTASPEIARQCEGMLRGTVATVVGSMMGTDSLLGRAAELGKSFGWVKAGDCLVAVHGMRDAVSGGSNMLKVLVVPE